MSDLPEIHRPDIGHGWELVHEGHEIVLGSVDEVVRLARRLLEAVAPPAEPLTRLLEGWDHSEVEADVADILYALGLGDLPRPRPE